MTWPRTNSKSELTNGHISSNQWRIGVVISPTLLWINLFLFCYQCIFSVPKGGNLLTKVVKGGHILEV